jgi:hypothetical protein
MDESLQALRKVARASVVVVVVAAAAAGIGAGTRQWNAAAGPGGNS